MAAVKGGRYWTSQDSVDSPAPFSSQFEFCWAYAAQMTMAPRLIVEGVNVVGDVSRSLVSVLVDPLFDSLLFQTAEEGFRNCIDAPMSSRTHRLFQVGQDQRVQLANNVAFEAAVDFFL